MPSPLRSIVCALPQMVLAVALSTRTDAQQLSATVSVPISITVRPAASIRSIDPRTPRVDASGFVVASAMVHVESNLPYRLTVRRATDADPAARIEIRRPDGSYLPLGDGAAVHTIAGAPPGDRVHEITCRVGARDDDSTGCALVYELTANTGEGLIRTTRRVAAFRPQASPTN